MATNPRSANGALRRKHRQRLKAMGGPCGICKGKLGPIRYGDPSGPRYPLSFVIDEIRPISRWAEFGYESKRAAAEDFENLQPAHYICNSLKSDKIGFTLTLREKVDNRPKKQKTSSDW